MRSDDDNLLLSLPGRLKLGIFAATDSHDPYRWSLVEKLSAGARFANIADLVAKLESPIPEVRFHAVSDIVEWGASTDCHGYAAGMAAFAFLFALDADRLRIIAINAWGYSPEISLWHKGLAA